MRKIFTVVFTISLHLSGFAQTKFKNIFSITNDNDLYISTYQDRYYTNGVFLTYRYASDATSDNFIKKINEIEIGQKLYSPYKANVSDISQHDRPFAGYLFVKFGETKFRKDYSFLSFSSEIGILGPSAYGEESMNFVHRLYGFNDSDGWKHQMKDALGLNINVTYSKPITTKNNFFDLHWKNSANLGTVFTDIASGVYSRIGTKTLQKTTNSVAFNSNINSNNSTFNTESESFFYINPMLRFAMYDATIQGSFLTKNNDVTYDLVPLVLTTEIGFWYTFNRMSLKYMITHHTKKLRSSKVPSHNFYGGIQIQYLFN